MNASTKQGRYDGVSDDALRILTRLRMAFAKALAEQIDIPIDDVVRVVTLLHEQNIIEFVYDGEQFTVKADYERIEAALFPAVGNA